MKTPPRHTVSLASTEQPLPLHEVIARWATDQARPCACGGVVIANVIDPSDGVRAHQQTPQHLEWVERTFE